MPIGFISVGWGGTKVEQWLPRSTDKFDRIVMALNEVGPQGARALLWHQGESDRGTEKEKYIRMLKEVINASRIEAGWELPWGVARASFCNKGSEKIVNAQQSVIDDDPLVFEGPNTDEMIGSEWRSDGCHFNENGLTEHARGWYNSITVLLQQIIKK
jgi:hypothetical protein